MSAAVLNWSEMVAAHARVRPRQLAVRDSRRSLDYAAWDERASRVAQALLGLGLQPGDRVALLAYNTIEWLELYAGLARAGLTAVPVNFRLAPPEIAYIAEHAEARAFVAQADLRAPVDRVRGELTRIEQRFISFGGTSAEGWLDYETLLAASSPEAPAVAVRCRSPAPRARPGVAARCAAPTGSPPGRARPASAWECRAAWRRPGTPRNPDRPRCGSAADSSVRKTRP